MADQDPKDPFAEFGGQADPFAEFGGQADDPFAEFGGQAAPTGDNLQFDVRTADDPRLKLRDITPQHGVAKEADAADYLTSGAGGAVQGASLGMRAPLDYATAGYERMLEAGRPIEGPDAIPRGASGPGIDAPLTESGFEQSLDATRAVRREAEERAPTTHLVGEIGGTVGTALVPGSPLAKLAGYASKVGGRVGAGVAGLAADPLGQAAGRGVVQQGIFARALGKTAELGTEGYLASAPFGAAHELDKAIENKDFEGVAEKMLSSAHQEGLRGAGYNVGIGGTLGLAKKGLQALPNVADFASGRAFKGLGGKKKDIALAEMRVKGGGEAVGRQMLDEGIVTYKDPSLEGTLDRAESVRANLGFQLGQVRKQIGDLGDAPSASSLWDKIESEVLAPSRKSPILRKDAEAVESRLADLKAELTANRPEPPSYDTLGMLKTPKGATHEPATYRPATPEDLELQRRMQAAQGTGDVNPESLGLRVPKQEYDTLGMPVSPRLAPESYTQGTRVPTPDELAMRQAMQQAPRGGTATPESLAAVGNSLEGVPLDPLGQPIGQGNVPPSPWRITGSKATPTDQVATSFGPGEQMSAPGYITGPAPGGAPPMVAVPGEMRLAPDEIDSERLTSLRIDVDKRLAQFDSQTDKPTIEMYRKVRNVMDRHWMEAAEEAAAKSGNPQLIEEVKDLSQRYARVAVGTNLLTETLARKAANRTFGLSDTLIGGTGASTGAAIGGLIAGPVGAAVGAPLGAVVGGVGNKIVREQGNAFMSSALHRTAKNTLKVQNTLKKAAGLDRLIRPKALSAVAAERAMTEVDVAKAVDHAEKLQDPESDEAKKTTSMLQEMEVEAGPEVVKALADKLTAQNEFILEKAGPAPPPSPFGGDPPKRDIDPELHEQLSRYIEPLTDPSEALARVGDGEATPEDYEVLETQYPKMWGEFQQTAVHGLADKDLDYDQRIAVSEALKLPLHPALSGDYLAYWQGVAVQGAAEDQVKADAQSESGKANLSGGKGVTSKADRAMV